MASITNPTVYFVHVLFMFQDYSIGIRNLHERDKIFLAGALGNYSLAGFEMVRFLLNIHITFLLPQVSKVNSHTYIGSSFTQPS
jgi:hypothetical protein